MKKIITLALFLAVVAGLSGAALSSVYEITDPIIQEQKIAKVKESLIKIYTSGEEFRAVETSLADYPTLKAVYVAESGGAEKGYIYECSVNGYSSSTPIQFIIALDKDGTYKGFETIDLSGETSGFGSKVGDPEFKQSVTGKNIGDSIDTISGATVSSSAVVTAIDEAVDHYEKNFQ